MATVFFFEKPGCGNNARQKKLLAASGHTVIAKDILNHPWSMESLFSFLEKKPVSEWFNSASPRIKSGEIDPEKLSEKEALELMLKDPLLIRRPLIEIEDRREAGFDQDSLNEWIGLSASLRDPEACLK